MALIRGGAKLGVTLLLIYLILRSVDLRQLLDTLKQASPPMLALQCVLYPIGLIIVSVRLRYILVGYGLRVTFSEAFRLNWIGAFFNNFLPSSIGGDLYRVLLLNRTYRREPAQVVSAIVIDRVLGLLAMLITAGVTSIFFVGTLIPATWVTVAVYLAGITVTAAGIFVLFVEHNLRISYANRNVIANKIINGLNVLLAYPDKKSLAASLLVSFLFMGLGVLAYQLLFLAFHTDISLTALLLVVPLVQLAGLVPISINAFGVTEGVGMVLFAQFGLEPEVVLSALLAGRVLLTLCSATGGLALFFAPKPPVVGSG